MSGFHRVFSHPIGCFLLWGGGAAAPCTPRRWRNRASAAVGFGCPRGPGPLWLLSAWPTRHHCARICLSGGSAPGLWLVPSPLTHREPGGLPANRKETINLYLGPWMIFFFNVRITQQLVNPSPLFREAVASWVFHGPKDLPAVLGPLPSPRPLTAGFLHKQPCDELPDLNHLGFTYDFGPGASFCQGDWLQMLFPPRLPQRRPVALWEPPAPLTLLVSAAPPEGEQPRQGGPLPHGPASVTLPWDSGEGTEQVCRKPGSTPAFSRWGLPALGRGGAARLCTAHLADTSLQDPLGVN